MSESGGSNLHPMDEAIREQEHENTVEDDLVRGASAALGVAVAEPRPSTIAVLGPNRSSYSANPLNWERQNAGTMRSIVTNDIMFEAALLRADTNRMRKSSSEPPSECKQLMDRLKKCTRIQLLEELSRISTWTFGKCELGYWKEILAIFDTILEEATYTSPNNKWQLACDSYDSSDKKLLLWILHFTTLLIEHSFSRHTYKSMDRLLALLTSSDMSVVLGVLNLLYMFSKRSNFITRMQCEQRIALIHRLHYLAESWGGKDNGFGLADCCNSKKPMPPSGTTLHFEFHNDQPTTGNNTTTNNKVNATDKNNSSTTTGPTGATAASSPATSLPANSKQNMTYIHVEQVDQIGKSPAEIMKGLVPLYNIPSDKEMLLFTHVRLAYHFSNYRNLLLCVQARLQALSVLVYANALQDSAHTMLHNGLLEELVELIELKLPYLVEIRSAALRTLTSIIHLDRNPHFPKKPGSRLNNIIDVTGASQYHGFLPVLVRNCIASLTSQTSNPPVSTETKPSTSKGKHTPSAPTTTTATAANLPLPPEPVETVESMDFITEEDMCSSAEEGQAGRSIGRLSSAVSTNALGVSGNKFPLPLATALFSFLYHLASYESGGDALVSCGMMESLLQVINWHGVELEHITFVTRAVRVIDLITNIDMQAFHNHGGLQSFINRLEAEVNLCVDEHIYDFRAVATSDLYDMPTPIIGSPRREGDQDDDPVPSPSASEASSSSSSARSSRASSAAGPEQDQEDHDQDQDDDEEADNGPVSEFRAGLSGNGKGDLVYEFSFKQQNVGRTCLPQRAALLKSMLNFLKKALQDNTFAEHIRHLMEGSLPQSLKHIISNAEYYGPSLFLLATDIITVYVFQEPSLLSIIQDNGLTDVVLQADVPPTREVLASLPNVFSALCLNARGLATFIRSRPFEKLFKVLLSPTYLSAMRKRRSSDPLGDAATNLGNAMDELMRHQPSLKADATLAIIKLLKELCDLGTDPKYVCWRPHSKSQFDISQSSRTTGARQAAPNDAENSSDDEDDDEEEASTSSQVAQSSEPPPPPPQPANHRCNQAAGSSTSDANASGSGEASGSTSAATSTAKIPIALTEYILNVTKFIDAVLSNNSTDDHCREFVAQGGLVRLLGILRLPNLPVDGPITNSAQAVASVCKSIVNLAQEPKVMEQGLLQLIPILIRLDPLHLNVINHGTTSKLLHELAHAPHLETAFTSATATPLLHAMSAAHGYVIMFVHVCRTGQNDIRLLTLQQWAQKDGLFVLKYLADLYMALVWESTLLLALCSGDVIPADCDFGREDMERLSAAQQQLAAADAEAGASSATATGAAPMDIDSDNESHSFNSSCTSTVIWGPWGTVKPTLQLKYIKPLLGASSRLGRALAELFGLLVKLCVGSPMRQRRGQGIVSTPSVPSPHALKVAMALNQLLSNGLDSSKLPRSPVPKFRLTFLICSVGFTSPMLFDEKRYPYHLMLQKFVFLGGQNKFFDTFKWALSADGQLPLEKGLEHPDLPEGTGEFLDAWLNLLEKMVNPKAILESPHIISAKASVFKMSFDPVIYMIQIQRLSFEAVMYLWGRKPLASYGTRMTDSILTILKHILRGEKMVKERLHKINDPNKPADASGAGKPTGASVTAGTSSGGSGDGTGSSAGATASTGGAEGDVSAENLRRLMDMGFLREHATEALVHTVTLEQATDYLLQNPFPSLRARLTGDVEMSEDDQVIQAIAMSLGEPVPPATVPVLSLPISGGDNAACESPVQSLDADPVVPSLFGATTPFRTVTGGAIESSPSKPSKESTSSSGFASTMATSSTATPSIRIQIEPKDFAVLCEEAVIKFTDGALKVCLDLIEAMPDTVFKACDLLVTIMKRNGRRFRDSLLEQLLADINTAMDELLAHNASDEPDKYCGTSETAQRLGHYVHLYTLFFEVPSYFDMRGPCGLAVVRSGLIPKLIQLVSSAEVIMLKRQPQHAVTPRWLTPCLLLLDSIGKVAEATRRKHLMHLSTRRVWKWYDAVRGNWTTYSPANNKLLNEAYWTGEQSARIACSRRRYTISFATMQQFNEESNNNRPVTMMPIFAFVPLEAAPEVCQDVLLKMDPPTEREEHRCVVIKGFAEEQAKEMVEACVALMSTDIDRDALHAIMRLCLRLTQKFRMAQLFVRLGGVARLVEMREPLSFNGYRTLSTLLIRHTIESPTTLASAMKKVVRDRLFGSTHPPNKDLLYLMRSICSLVSRDPYTYYDLAKEILRIDINVKRADDSDTQIPVKMEPTACKNTTPHVIKETESIQVIHQLIDILLLPIETNASTKTAENSVDSSSTDGSTPSNAKPSGSQIRSTDVLTPADPVEVTTASGMDTAVITDKATTTTTTTAGTSNKQPTPPAKRILTKQAVLKILADAVVSYPGVAQLIAEYTYKTRPGDLLNEDCSCLAFLFDKIVPVAEPFSDSECSTVARTLIAGIASCNHAPDVQAVLVAEVKAALVRALLLPESAEKHARLQYITGIILSMIEQCPPVQQMRIIKSQTFNVNVNNIARLMLRNRIFSDLAKVAHCLDMSSPNFPITMNSAMKPMECLSKIVNQPITGNVTGNVTKKRQRDNLDADDQPSGNTTSSTDATNAQGEETVEDTDNTEHDLSGVASSLETGNNIGTTGNFLQEIMERMFEPDQNGGGGPMDIDDDPNMSHYDHEADVTVEETITGSSDSEDEVEDDDDDNDEDNEVNENDEEVEEEEDDIDEEDDDAETDTTNFREDYDNGREEDIVMIQYADNDPENTIELPRVRWNENGFAIPIFEEGGLGIGIGTGPGTGSGGVGGNGPSAGEIGTPALHPLLMSRSAGGGSSGSADGTSTSAAAQASSAGGSGAIGTAGGAGATGAGAGARAQRTGRPRRYQYLQLNARNANPPVILQRLLGPSGTHNLHIGPAGAGVLRDSARVVVMDNFSIFPSTSTIGAIGGIGGIGAIDETFDITESGHEPYFYGRPSTIDSNHVTIVLHWWQEESRFVDAEASAFDISTHIVNELIPNLLKYRRAEALELKRRKEGEDKTKPPTHIVNLAPPFPRPIQIRTRPRSTVRPLMDRTQLLLFPSQRNRYRNLPICDAATILDADGIDIDEDEDLGLAQLRDDEEAIEDLLIPLTPPEPLYSGRRAGIDGPLSGGSESSVIFQSERNFRDNRRTLGSLDINSARAEMLLSEPMPPNMMNTGGSSSSQPTSGANTAHRTGRRAIARQQPSADIREHQIETAPVNISDFNSRFSLRTPRLIPPFYSEEQTHQEVVERPQATTAETTSTDSVNLALDLNLQDSPELVDDSSTPPNAIRMQDADVAVVEVEPSAPVAPPIDIASISDTTTVRNTIAVDGEEIPEGVDPSFLDALPADMRREVLEQHRLLRLQQWQPAVGDATRSNPSGSTAEEGNDAATAGEASGQAVAGLTDAAQSDGNQSTQQPTVVLNDVNPEFLAALPPSLQEEVLIQQRLEQQRQAAARANPDEPIDAGAFFETLQPSLRAMILSDMEDSQMSALPPDLAAEAQTLRRDWEARNRQMVQERFFQSNLTTIIRHSTRSRLSSRFNTHLLPQWAQRGGTDAAFNSALGGVGGLGSASNMKIRGRQLLDHEALSCLLVLLFVDDPKLNTARLHRVIRNLCYHVPTKDWVVRALLSIIERSVNVKPDEVSAKPKRAPKPGPLTSKLVTDTKNMGNGANWLNIRMEAALGCHANVFIVNRPPGKRSADKQNTATVTIHPQAARIVCRNALDLFTSLSRTFPSFLLPLRSKPTAETPPKTTEAAAIAATASVPASSPSQRTTGATKHESTDFWDMLLRLDAASTKKGKSLAKLHSTMNMSAEVELFNITFEQSSFGQLLGMLSAPVIRQSVQLTDKLLKLLSVISTGMPELSKNENGASAVGPNVNANGTNTGAGTSSDASGADSSDPKQTVVSYESVRATELALTLAVNVLTYKSCSEEGLEEVTTLLLNFSNCSLDMSRAILVLLFNGARRIGEVVREQIQDMLDELRSVHKTHKQQQKNVAGPSGSEEPTPGTSKGVLSDRFTKENVVIVAPSKVKASCDLQLPSMAPLTSKSSNQVFFLRVLRVIVQIRDTIEKRIEKEKVALTKIAETNNTNSTTAATTAAHDVAIGENDSPSPFASSPPINPVEPPPSPSTSTATIASGSSDDSSPSPSIDSLSSQLIQLETLWNTLSQCLLELEHTPDHHAVLVLQPAVEAFFLVHSPQQQQQQQPRPPVSAVVDVDAASTSAMSADNESIILLPSPQPSAANTNEKQQPGQHSTQAQALAYDHLKFLSFAEKHRTVLNQILRQTTAHLADGPFSVLVDHTRVLDFDIKRRYFRTELERMDQNLRREETAVHVRREHIFEDSFRELYRRSPEEWKNRFYIVFEDEEGQDAGGLLREWYVVISRDIFNPMYALFTVSPGDRVTYMINPASHYNPNHLCYYKFVGRVIAKAIYDNKLLECYFTRSFYKHILGISVKYTDMESEDYSFYRGLVYLMENNINNLGCDLTFSTEIDEFGVTETRDLIENGRNVNVTEENKMEYVRRSCQMKMTGAIRQQLTAFLEGFYDIIPKHLISIFNEQELELLISGLPNVDIDDLRGNTEYHKYQISSLQIQWFWRALRSFDQADRAKFLQFVTGTSKVPLQGFGALEGMNGVQKFQIHRDDRSTDRLPSAHTCFNQLDLPVYETYDKLRSYLLKAIHECSEGFGFA